CLAASMMQTKRALASAMIFSRASAAPPPLLSRPCESHPSAPSPYSSSGPLVLSPNTSIPRLRSCRVLCSELDTAPAMRWRILASASMKQATVEPVPTPTIMPSSTNSMAFSPARRLCSDMGVLNRKWEVGIETRSGRRDWNRDPGQGELAAPGSPDHGSNDADRPPVLLQRQQQLPLRRRHRQHRQP